MKVIHVELKMQSYIAHPYWAARNTCIEIEKYQASTGRSRKRSDRLH